MIALLELLQVRSDAATRQHLFTLICDFIVDNKLLTGIAHSCTIAFMKTKRVNRKELKAWLNTTFPTSRDLADAVPMSRQAAYEILIGNVEPRVATLESLGVEFIVPIHPKQ